MKKILIQIISAVLLISLCTVAVSAEKDEQAVPADEKVEWSTEYFYADIMGTGENQITLVTDEYGNVKVVYYELATGDFSFVIGGGKEDVEYRTYVFGEGDFFVMTGDGSTPIYNIFVGDSANEKTSEGCSAVIAPVVSATLVSGALVAAWILKKRKNDDS